MAASSSVSVSSDAIFSFSDGCSLEGIESRDERLQTIRDRLGQVVADTLQHIAAKTEEAMQGYQRDKSYLDTAIWYPNDYAHALREGKFSERLKHLRDNGNLRDGYVSSKHFEQYVVGGKKKQWEFIVKDKILPSEALKKAIEGLSILDCGSVCQLARYNSLRVVLGDEKFNKLFSRATGEAMNIGFPDHDAQPMRYFVNFTLSAKEGNSGTKGNRPIKVGHIISFNNSFKYHFRHRIGMGGNYNLGVIDSTPGGQRVCGHGTSSKGFSEDDLLELFVFEYDKEPENEETRSLPGNVFAKGTLRKEEIPGYDPYSPQGFNLVLIHDLVERKIEDIGITFVKEHRQAKDSLEVIAGKR